MALKTYKYRNTGIRSVSVTKSKDGKEWKEFPFFERHTLTTGDPDVQKKVEELIAKEKDLPLVSRLFFFESEWDEIMTPDKVFIEDGNGGTIHRSVLLEAYHFACSNGFKAKQKIVIEEGGSNVEQGVVSSGKVAEKQKGRSGIK